MQNYCCACPRDNVTIASRLRPKQKTAPEQQELIPRTEAAPATPLEVIKIEKNLNSLGFFTPSHKGLDNKKSKSITISREDRGRKMQAKATIYPSPDHGLPTTADQDKYFAFQKIVTELKKRTGVVANPIGFTSYQLLKILGVNASGKNYEEVGQWLERMTLTGIRSENMVYFAGRKTWAKDIFHVFDRAVQVGQQLPDGTTADQNYVWLSEWQLENLNANYVLPLDLHTYRQLRSTIAKALVPLLQIWFYASGRRPIEKRYGDLCQYLQIRRWPHLSKVRENFAPALEELRTLSFLELWDIQRTADNLDFKIILHPGRALLARFPAAAFRPGAGAGAASSGIRCSAEGTGRAGNSRRHGAPPVARCPVRPVRRGPAGVGRLSHSLRAKGEILQSGGFPGLPDPQQHRASGLFRDQPGAANSGAQRRRSTTTTAPLRPPRSSANCGWRKLTGNIRIRRSKPICTGPCAPRRSSAKPGTSAKSC